MRSAHELAAANVVRTIRCGGLRRRTTQRLAGSKPVDIARHKGDQARDRAVNRANLEAALSGLAWAHSAGLSVAVREIEAHITAQWGPVPRDVTSATVRDAADKVEAAWHREPWRSK